MPGQYRIILVWTKDELLDPCELDFSESTLNPALQGFSKWFYWNELKEDEWSVGVCHLMVTKGPTRDVSMALEPTHQFLAVRPFDLEGEESDYWAPLVFDELRKGRARFSWSNSYEDHLRLLKRRPESHTAEQRDSWQHSKFLLDLGSGDYLVYVNVPSYGECSVVELEGRYYFTGPWDPEGRGDLRHVVPCRYIGTFDRNGPAVHPELSKRLKIKRSHWKLEAVRGLVCELISRLSRTP